MAAPPAHAHADVHQDEPSQLLLGLPDLAAQCLVSHLSSSSSRTLVNLMRTSRESRALVVAQAPNATYQLGAGQCSRMSRAALHAMAQRATGNLQLNLKAVGDDSETQLAQLLSEAVQRGRWTAVKALVLEVSSTDAEHCGHLVGPACPGMQQLEIRATKGNTLVVGPTLLAGLGYCQSLSHLTLPHSDMSPAAAEQAAMLPVLAPGLKSLTTACPQSQAPVSALAGQLTALVWYSPLFLSDPQCVAALSACTNLVRVELFLVHGRAWLDSLLQLPALKHVTVDCIGDHLAWPADAAAPPPQLCSWETLTVDELHIFNVPWLVLPGLQQLHLSQLSLEPSCIIDEQAWESMGARTMVDAAVSALLPLAQQGGLVWTEHGGEAQLDVEGLQRWAGALAGLAPLAPHLPPVRLRVSEREQQQATVTGSQLAQLLASLAGLQLSRLGLLDHGPSQAFFAALRQSPTVVRTVMLRHCREVQEADFALFLSHCPRPMHVELHMPSAAAAASVQAVQQALTQHGLQSSVEVVVIE